MLRGLTVQSCRCAGMTQLPRGGAWLHPAPCAPGGFLWNTERAAWGGMWRLPGSQKAPAWSLVAQQGAEGKKHRPAAAAHPPSSEDPAGTWPLPSVCI